VIGWLARRIAWTLVVVWFVVTSTFLLAVAMPAEPMRAMLGPHATPETIARARAQYCLDEGLLVQYGCFVGRLARGDLGESFRSQRPVRTILAERIGPTAQLAVAALALQLALGIPLGVLAAARRGRWPDHAASLGGLVALSAPTFVVGTVLLYVFAYALGWFPLGGHGAPGLDRLYHLVLPAATLAAIGIASYARVIRYELEDVLDEDYVRTARAKGLAERDVIVRHALRPALGPLVALVGIDLGALLGGAIVTEAIFSWPGLGREVMLAITEVDLPLLLGVVLVTAIAVALANLIADLVQRGLDPRLREP
jgi:peptide/nickel transport system permease protein